MKRLILLPSLATAFFFLPLISLAHATTMSTMADQAGTQRIIRAEKTRNAILAPLLVVSAAIAAYEFGWLPSGSEYMAGVRLLQSQAIRAGEYLLDQTRRCSPDFAFSVGMQVISGLVARSILDQMPNDSCPLGCSGASRSGGELI